MPRRWFSHQRSCSLSHFSAQAVRCDRLGRSDLRTSPRPPFFVPAMQLAFSALALLGLLGLAAARPQQGLVHPTLAVDLLQSRSPKAWLRGLKAPKCHDRKVVDSNSILAAGVSDPVGKMTDVYIESQLGAENYGTFGPWIQLFQGDKFLQCPTGCPIYADDRASALLGLRLIWTNLDQISIVYRCLRIFPHE